MGKLTKNGYDYYKTLDRWEPIEAALIVCGIDPFGVNFENIPEDVWNIYAQSTIEDTYENPLIFPEKKLQDRDQITKYEKYCRKFCKDQGELNTRMLTCFEPRFYVSMMKDHFDNIDASLNIIIDPSNPPKLRWATEPSYNEQKPKSEFIINPTCVIEDEEDPDKILQIYEEMKEEYPWTLDEGILLLGCPLCVHKDWKTYEYDGYEYSLGSSLRRKFSKAINGDSLTVLGIDTDKSREGWRNDYGRRYVNPFEFLELVRTKKLFNIPPQLEWKNFSSATGEFQYFWKSNLNEDGIPKNSDMISEALIKKEKQETGKVSIYDKQQGVFEQPKAHPIEHQSNDPEKRIDQILLRIMPDIELFYEEFKIVEKSHNYDTDQSQDYRKFAIEAFEKIKMRLQYLKKDDLQGLFKEHEPSEQMTRKKAMLAKNFIRRIDPSLSSYTKNVQDLKIQMNNLKSQSIVSR